MITNLYLVRHGQTQWNIEKRLQGRLDSPLTDTGVEQAKGLAERLDEIPFSCIYSSSSHRALETASYLKKRQDMEIIPTDSLMEMSFGVWEGREWTEIQELFPTDLICINESPELYKASESQGETLYDVENRAIPFLQQLLKEHNGSNILVVSHSITIKVIVNYFRGGSMKTVWKGPDTTWASVYQIQFSPDGVTILFEDEEIFSKITR
ncbi:histidine phosphatase family protein [Baia soyae]|uniref:Phosphoglycerate mutase n=1 Tax=Baia soyae TaxID=1544746 RepID=A0A4R2RG58_9BACL|nr:histidine phosphatase family protein [Baia soyae]TCP61538.1 phosphoglycerate mutase [Baia soyae]